MKQEQGVPPGIIKMISDDGKIHDLIPPDDQKPYYDCFEHGCKVETIEVDGKQFSIGDETNWGIIKYFEYSFANKCWAMINTKEGFYRTWASITKLPSAPQPGEGYADKIERQRQELKDFMKHDPQPQPSDQPEEDEQQGKFSIARKAFENYISSLSDELYYLRKEVSLKDHYAPPFEKEQAAAREALANALNPMNQWIDKRVAHWNKAMQEISTLQAQEQQLRDCLGEACTINLGNVNVRREWLAKVKSLLKRKS